MGGKGDYTGLICDLEDIEPLLPGGVDYSYANQRQATDAERKEVYERLKTLCERLESGELKVAPNETLQSSLRSAVCLIRSVLARLHARKNGFFSIRMSMGMMRI